MSMWGPDCSEPEKDWSAWKYFKIVLAGFFPPAAVFLTIGVRLHFWLNILLTGWFYIPGVIHAIFIVFVDGDTPKWKDCQASTDETKQIEGR